MDKMSLYTQEKNNLEDLILDNYVALWRQVIGDKRLFVATDKFRFSRHNKGTRVGDYGMCACGNHFKITYVGKKVCGDKREKTGCAFKNYLRGVKNGKKGLIKYNEEKAN